MPFRHMTPSRPASPPDRLQAGDEMHSCFCDESRSGDGVLVRALVSVKVIPRWDVFFPDIQFAAASLISSAKLFVAGIGRSTARGATSKTTPVRVMVLCG